MPYDLDEIEKYTLLEWDGDDYYIFQYVSKWRGKTNEATNLILDFKKGINEAIEMAEDILVNILDESVQDFRDKRRCKYILSIPSSSARKINYSCEQVCKVVEKKVKWLSHLPKALERTKTVPKSAFSKPGERPTYADHKSTIKYNGPEIDPGCGIIMFDDVITKKATSSACRDIIKEATGCKRVTGIFLGRTW